MNVRYAIGPAFALALLAGALAPSSAADDRQLQNVKGDVSYQLPNKAPVPIALNASVGLPNQTYAITGTESLGAVILPDSSEVMVGSQSKVELAAFDQTTVANAKFVIYDGKVRFAVRHPKGAQANYTFTTPSGTVAVRGTQGDIAYDGDKSLRVNVYELCDPHQPVRITLAGGRAYDVDAGQSLAVQYVNGVLTAQVQQLTQQLIDQFSPEFGVPTSWDQAKGEVVSYAQNTAAGAINGATGGYGGTIVQGVSGLFGHKSTPKPSPGPTPATCS